MMQASAAAPISGIPVLEIVPGDIPVTVLAERLPARRPIAPARSLQELLASERARHDEAPTTMRGPELLSPFAEARTERIFAEEPTELPPQLLKAHRRTLWLATSTITAWMSVLVAALVWMLTTSMWAQRAEASGVSDFAPRIPQPAVVAPKPTPAPVEVAPKPAVVNKPVAPMATVAPPSEEPAAEETAVEQAPAPIDPAAHDMADNPYTD